MKEPFPHPSQISYVKPGERIEYAPVVSPERIVALWEAFFANINGKQGDLKDDERRAFAISMQTLATPPFLFSPGNRETSP